jgi:hypothetical protein
MGAEMFARACEQNDLAALYEAVDFLDRNTVDGWRCALAKVAKLSGVSAEIRSAFLPVWIEHKMLPLRVGDRRIVANALRVLLPASTARGPMRLFRGTSGDERLRRRYGFSWSSQLDVARAFAEHWVTADRQSVVLETVAPGESILLVREQEGYYDEGEVIIDPFMLSRVDVVERLSTRP